MPMKYYCADSYSALLYYAASGLHPGGFVEALLNSNLPLAYRRAHRALVPVERGGHAEKDIVRNMYDLVEDRFAPVMYGSRDAVGTWIAHRGYWGAPKLAKAMVLLFCEPAFIRTIDRLGQQCHRDFNTDDRN